MGESVRLQVRGLRKVRVYLYVGLLGEEEKMGCCDNYISFCAGWKIVQRFEDDLFVVLETYALAWVILPSDLYGQLLAIWK